MAESRGIAFSGLWVRRPRPPEMRKVPMQAERAVSTPRLVLEPGSWPPLPVTLRAQIPAQARGVGFQGPRTDSPAARKRPWRAEIRSAAWEEMRGC